jgi:nitronate monooxygenase
MMLDEIPLPIVLAPLAVGPCTPQLVAAVCEAGGLGTLAGGYLPTTRLADQLRELRSLTGRPFGVNVFVPPAHPADPAIYSAYVEELRRWSSDRNLPIGEPRFSDDGFAEKLDLLIDEPVSVVSFTFGMPAPEVIGRLRGVGSEVWVTVTTPTEAATALAGGADVLVLQGVQAGGHRGSFEDDDRSPAYPVLSLLQLLWGAGRPLVATGGIVTGSGIAAALAAGARAAQLGTAFLLCPEAGTSQSHRGALRQGGAPTGLTRAFTGRTGRGIVNHFMVEHDGHAVSAYPEIHYVTQPLRAAAHAIGDASLINLWAGETYPLIRELPAAAVVGLLARELHEALRMASATAGVRG